MFAPLPNSRAGKIHCVVCGRTGYDVEHPKSWKNTCRRGHAPCPRCGKMLAVLANGAPRTHARCPNR